MKILHLYGNPKEARRGWEAYLQTLPDRFFEHQRMGFSRPHQHYFLEMGLWSSFSRIQTIRPDQIKVYFSPNQRTLNGIRTFSKTPENEIHFVPSGVNYAG